MIIVEGVDNSGKSTLIKELLEEYPSLQFGGKPGGPPEKIGRDNLYNWWYDVVDSCPTETYKKVYDRFYFSELVYGPVIRGGVSFHHDELATIMNKLRIHQPLIIYCNVPINQVYKNFNKREQLKGVKENIHKLKEQYEDVMMTLQEDKKEDFRILRYDYTDPSSKENLDKELKNYLSKVKWFTIKGKRRREVNDYGKYT